MRPYSGVVASSSGHHWHLCGNPVQACHSMHAGVKMERVGQRRTSAQSEQGERDASTIVHFGIETAQGWSWHALPDLSLSNRRYFIGACKAHRRLLRMASFKQRQERRVGFIENDGKLATYQCWVCPCQLNVRAYMCACTASMSGFCAPGRRRLDATQGGSARNASP